ncbi:hypothetical protein C2G38_2201805 [Gigaspora rosea]|uniref:Uncharacterized protein n=1 Tax=Gigaspora rosea TaxID=44941 RepID=A0A397UXR9_9GLOM|nr:hypothetical protein C2G38_2201805 [Gigaspora rosea]
MSQQPRNPQRNNSYPQARRVPNHAQIRGQQQNLIANRARQQRLILEYLRSTEIGLLTLEENIGRQHRTQDNVPLNGSGLINQAAIVAIQTSTAIFANRNRINNTIAVQETNFIPRLRNTLRKYIKPTEEILIQIPIEEVQLDIEVTIKELISHCSPTSNHRLEQTLVVLQQALEVNGLIPNDTAIFVHEQQQRQTEYINLLTATYQQIGSIKWKLISATKERLIPYFITQIIVHGANSLQGILTNEGANFVQEEPTEIKVVPKTEYSSISTKYKTLYLQHLNNTIYQIFTHLPKDTDIILVLKSQITAQISVIPDRYIFGKVILRVFSTDIPPHKITTSLFTTQAEKALHPYGLLKEEIKEEAYYCVTISDKDPLQIIAHQGTPSIKINIYKDTNNQPFIGNYYYVIILFDNLLEDEIFIKIDIWHEYIYIKGKVQTIIA